MTRAEAIVIIESLANAALTEEMLFMRDDVEREDTTYDLYDAFIDSSDIEGNSECSSTNKANIRNIKIALGWYVPVSEEELSRTICMSGGAETKNYAFKYKGVKYRFNHKNLV